VDPVAAAPYLNGTGLQLATFGDSALASLDLQFYTATYGVQSNFAKPQPISGMSVTTEIEFNILGLSGDAPGAVSGGHIG
jgi:hypothetical protein